ncbi:MAG: NFACT family protein, partial [Candidatus Thermoplasmatota archaeon]|nr:NFACT family protein [Candidatus Thermoplasmatota archaeon]
MKKALSSPDLRVLVEGWQSLIGARVEQVQRPEANLLHFKLRHRQRGGLRLLVDLQGWTWLGDAPAGAPTSGGFITELRRHIRKARLERVAQLGADRILELHFSIGETRPVLLLELFHRGNALLCEEGVIVQALRRQQFRHRTLAPGQPYQPPPSTFDPFRADEAQFAELLAVSERELVPALAVECNLGGDLAETAARGLMGTRAAALPSTGVATLWQRIRELLDGEKQPGIFFRAGEPNTVSPFLLEGYDERRDFQSLDEAIAAFRDLRPLPAEQPDADERRLTKQREAAELFEAEAAQLRRDGELLFAHVTVVAAALQAGKPDHHGRLMIELEGR